MYYKYFSELSTDQVKSYDTQQIDSRYASERGTVLGVTLPNVNDWVMGTKESPK